MSVRFYELLEAKINSSLKKNVGLKKMTKDELAVIRNEIFKDVESTFNHGKHRLSTEAC